MASRLLIVCPEYPPLATGLAGHTRAFAEELAKTHEVFVLTGARPESETAGGKTVRVLPVVRSWGFLGIPAALRAIREANPDRVLLQYLPFLYSPRGGINFGICALAWALRLSGRKVDLVCHELYYPLGARPKAIVMFFSHVAMLFLLGLAANRVFATTALFVARAKRILLGREVHALPVGSNMPRMDTAAEELAHFRKGNRLDGKRVLTCFGTAHPTRDFELVLGAICDWSDEKAAPVAILCVGESRERILKELTTKTRARAETRLVALGKIDETRFALAMAASDAAVAYFRDGASTRRGSLMATLAYGIPTISSRAPSTDEALVGLRDLTLLPAQPEAFRASFSAAVARALDTPGARGPDGLYQERFGWDKIVDRFQFPEKFSK